jgi:F-type H+-transporting ATPase subunit b
VKIIGAFSFAIILVLVNQAEAADGQAANFGLRMINYVVFLGILLFFIRKPLGKVINKRRETIKEELQALQAEQEEAARLSAEAAALLTKAEEESKRLLEEYRLQAEQEKARILEQAAQQIKHMHEQAKLTIARELIIARENLKKELAAAAVSSAEEILRQQISVQDLHNLNQEFLKQMNRANAQ